MDDVLDLITSRRTVKEFIPKFVSWEKISRVLDAARHAPSCGNVQNWRFIVVMKPEGKQQLADLAHEQYEIVQAAALIVVCSEPEVAERYYGSKGKELYSIQNCAAAIQNMLLEAHSLGLGTRWVGAFDEDAVKEALKIPAEISIQAVVALGYPKMIPEKPPKYPLESLVFFGSWRNRMTNPEKYMNDISLILAKKAKAGKEALQKGKDFLVGKVKDVISKKEE